MTFTLHIHVNYQYHNVRRINSVVNVYVNVHIM